MRCGRIENITASGAHGRSRRAVKLEIEWNLNGLQGVGPYSPPAKAIDCRFVQNGMPTGANDDGISGAAGVRIKPDKVKALTLKVIASGFERVCWVWSGGKVGYCFGDRGAFAAVARSSCP
jgi:hypothetical protein